MYTFGHGEVEKLIPEKMVRTQENRARVLAAHLIEEVSPLKRLIYRVGNTGETFACPWGEMAPYTPEQARLAG